MKISYRDSIEDLTESHLRGFLQHRGFVPAEGTLEAILRGSSRVAIAIDEETAQVVGYICSLSDQVSCTYISHLEVRDSYRGRGIGTGLVDRLLNKSPQTFGTYLSCAPSLESFYVKKGFKKSLGMAKRARV